MLFNIIVYGDKMKNTEKVVHGTNTKRMETGQYLLRKNICLFKHRSLDTFS